MFTGIDELAREVLKEYDLAVDQLTTIQADHEKGKFLWRFESQEGPKCLKRMHRRLEKSLFAIEAHVHLRRAGATVPGIILTRRGQPYVASDGAVFLVIEWVNGRRPDVRVPSDLELMTRVLGDFHRRSKGFEPSEGVEISTKLGKWPNHYEEMTREMLEAREFSLQNSESLASKILLDHVDHFIGQAQKALSLLQFSPYEQLVKRALEEKGLCHQDFGETNCLISPSGVYVLDLDGVTYDLFARDLSKLIYKVMGERRTWDEALLDDILRWYGEVNPLAPEEIRVLLIDILFPHEFHSAIKNDFRGLTPLKPKLASKVQRTVMFERSKENVLRSYGID